MAKTFLISGVLFMMLGVIIGAFGAHGLKSQVSENMLANYQTGVQYHFYHALGLILLGLYVHAFGASALTGWAGGLLIAGIIIFSGSLYVMALTGAKWLGAITPIGGTAFIGGWLLWLISAWQINT